VLIIEPWESGGYLQSKLVENNKDILSGGMDIPDGLKHDLIVISNHVVVISVYEAINLLIKSTETNHRISFHLCLIN